MADFEPDIKKDDKVSRQAGAELCQAQFKLGLAKSALLGKGMRSSSMYKTFEVIFYLQRK